MITFFTLILMSIIPSNDFEVVAPPPVEVEVVIADITKYAWTGKRMANGEYPYIGVAAVSDRSIPLGSKVIIGDDEYIIKDRTAKWVWDKFGLLVDIYSEETKEEMLECGRRKMSVEIIL